MKTKIAGITFVLVLIATLVWRLNDEGATPKPGLAQKSKSVQVSPNPNRVLPVENTPIVEIEDSMESLPDTETMRAVSPEDNQEHLQLAQDLEQLEKVFDEVEERWNRQMRDLMISEFGLGEEEYKRYQQLREEYDMAKIQAFEDYHQKLEETHGEDAVYRMTLAEEEFQEPIQTEYENRMHKLFGDDLYQRYLGVRDQFNNDLRAEAQTQLPLFFIDL